MEIGVRGRLCYVGGSSIIPSLAVRIINRKESDFFRLRFIVLAEHDIRQTIYSKARTVTDYSIRNIIATTRSTIRSKGVKKGLRRPR